MGKLIPQADAVVRDFVPTVLESGGSHSAAARLRKLEPISDSKSLTRACRILRALDIPHEDPEWSSLVQDLAFWSEAAIWAAQRDDAISFRDHIMKAHATIMLGLDRNYTH